MIAVEDISYVRYQVTDLDRMEAFLLDFGLHRCARTDTALYMRAAGSNHHCHVSELGPENRSIGFGLKARSEADLAIIASKFETSVEQVQEPGGGKRVRLLDPAGFFVDILHGQAGLAPLPTRQSIASNPADRRQRMGQTIRLKPAPSAVMRLGHVAVLVANFSAAHAFYSEVLGMKASDTYWAGDQPNTIAAFMHCGLGEQWTDHHTIALIAATDGCSRFDHSAFEVLDLDDVMQGSAHLKNAGYEHSWGVGRHIQGSQIFDYWRDPFGNKIEHWTDGDLVNDGSPVGHTPIGADELQQWAPPLNPAFFE